MKVLPCATVAQLDRCHCDTCGLYDKRRFQPVGGAGPHNARIVLVSEAPGRIERALGLPMVGESGQLLNEVLHIAGLDRKDCYATNAVLCQPPEYHTVAAAEIAACGDRLEAEILALPERHIIVALGGPAIRALTGESHSVTSLQGRVEWSRRWNAFLLYTWNPAAISRNPDNYLDFLYTLRKCRGLLDVPKGPIAPHAVRYVLEDDTQACIRRLTWMLTHVRGNVSCDIETTGLDWQTDSITQLGFSWEDGWAYLLPAALFTSPAVVKLLMRLFRQPGIRWIWHNGKFDVQFLRGLLGYVPRIDEDSMLLHYLIDERGGGGGEDGGSTHKLKPLAYKYCNAPVWDEGIKESKDFTNPVYHAHDLVYTGKLYDALSHEHTLEPPSPLGYPQPLNAYQQVVMPAINAVAEIELRGVLIDEAEMARLGTKMEAELTEREARCQSLCPLTFPKKGSRYEDVPYIKTTGRGNNKISVETTKPKRVPIVEQVPINVRSVPQVREFVYGYLGLLPMYAEHSSSGEPTVNEDAIKTYRAVHPFMDELLKYRSVHKLYTTYVKGITRRIGSDGATHSHFSLHTTVTGRPSSMGPNIQNIPKAVKSPFIARPGYVLMEADYSNQEIRMGALLSGDEQLRADIRVKDFHWEVTKDVFKVIVDPLLAAQGSYAELGHLLAEQLVFRSVLVAHQQHPYEGADKLFAAMRDHIRKAAKAVSFGVMYGEGGKGLMETLHYDSQIDITLEEGDYYIANWLEKYPGFAAWAEARRRDVVTTGFVDTPLGRRRRFHLVLDQTRAASERQAMNMPIQSTSSDMTMLSVVKLHKDLRRRKLGYVLFFVHDSVICEIVQGREQEAALLIQETMQTIINDIVPNSPVLFPVEIKLGHRWSDLLSMDKVYGNGCP